MNSLYSIFSLHNLELAKCSRNLLWVNKLLIILQKKVFVEKRLVSFLFVGFFNLNEVLGFKLRRREA